MFPLLYSLFSFLASTERCRFWPQTRKLRAVRFLFVLRLGYGSHDGRWPSGDQPAIFGLHVASYLCNLCSCSQLSSQFSTSGGLATPRNSFSLSVSFSRARPALCRQQGLRSVTFSLSRFGGDFWYLQFLKNDPVFLPSFLPRVGFRKIDTSHRPKYLHWID